MSPLNFARQRRAKGTGAAPPTRWPCFRSSTKPQLDGATRHPNPRLRSRQVVSPPPHSQSRPGRRAGRSSARCNRRACRRPPIPPRSRAVVRRMSVKAHCRSNISSGANKWLSAANLLSATAVSICACACPPPRRCAEIRSHSLLLNFLARQ